jgi:hypothetical protein
VVQESQQAKKGEEAMKLVRPQLLKLAGTAIASIGISASLWGAEPNIVANWNLVSVFTKDLATGKRDSPLGEHPTGHIIFTPQGRMMVLNVHEKRTPPKTDQDRIDLHKYMLAYSGRYEVTGDKIVTHVDISWNESLTGTDQLRLFKLEGDKLTITSPVNINNPSAWSVLVWEREH